MNYDAIYAEVRSKTTAVFRERFPEPGIVREVADFDARIARLRALQTKIVLHRRHMKRVSEKRISFVNMERLLDKVERMISEGAQVLSLDTEFSMSRNSFIYEVGISTHQSGVTSTVNYRIRANSQKYMGVMKPFNFGATKWMSQDEAKERLITAWAGADIIVGQSLDSDFRALSRNGCKLEYKPVVLDLRHVPILTKEFGYSDFAIKLGDFANRCGVPTPNPHCAGNDSRYALDATLAFLALRGSDLTTTPPE